MSAAAPAEGGGWQNELELDHRRRLRNAGVFSLALHVVLFAAFALPPSHPTVPLPPSISVELVALPANPGASPAARPAPPAPKPPAAKPAPKPPAAKPAPKPPAAKPAPKPAPAPEPVAPPPPPMPKAPVQVLPEETPGRIQKVAEEARAKPAPKPAPEPAPVRPAPDPELSYEEAMAALDQELGVDETAELLAPTTPAETSGEPAEPTGQPASSRGVVVSPELAAWSLETRRRIQSVWVTPAAFRGRGLATSLELRLSATGEVLGEPRVVGSSGDPYFDDNAVRAVLKANPLPPPPKPGQRVFVFRSEAD